MKNKLLLFATFVLVSLGAIASTSTSKINRYYIDYGNSFTFVERGVTFAVFQNGEFDFYINQRNGVNFGYRSSHINISFNSGYNYDAYVQYDNYGAIIQVEDIPIYYDYYGRVNRIGNINIHYNHGRLVSVGRLYVHYDSYGYYSHYSGYINHHNRHYVYHPYHNYFVRPLFDFRIVSYKPYRNHYIPVRYKYYKDHSRNKYYSKKSNKYYRRNNHNTRQRVATNKIPKRRNDIVARIDRGNTKRNSIQRTTKNSRNEGVNRTRRNTTVNKPRVTTHTNTDRKRTVTSRATNIAKQSNGALTERKPVRVQEKRVRMAVRTRKPVTVQKRTKTVNSRKPIRVQEKRSSATARTRKPATVQKRSKIVNSRKAVKTQARKSTVSTTRRKSVKRASDRKDYGKRRRG